MNEYTFLVRSVRDALNAGESQRSLAKLAGVSHATISKLISGKSEDVSLKTYRVLLDAAQSAVGRNAMQPKTLHDKVEAIAADRVDHDKGAWDVDLNCAKYRRVMQLEKELEQTQHVLTQREQHLRSCENALIEAHEKIDVVLQQRNKFYDEVGSANAEIKRLTALSDTHGQNWKAACVQVEQLQKQLDQGQTAYSKLHNQLGATRTKYETQLEKANQKDVQREEFLTKVYADKTQQEAQIMRLRVYVWILFAALVFVVASGLVVWGAA